MSDKREDLPQTRETRDDKQQATTTTTSEEEVDLGEVVPEMRLHSLVGKEEYPSVHGIKETIVGDGRILGAFLPDSQSDAKKDQA